MNLAVASTRPRDHLRGPVLDPGDPMLSARVFVEQLHTSQNAQTLRHQSGEFFSYDAAGAYKKLSADTVRAELYRFLETARQIVNENGDQNYAPFQPTRGKVANVVDALGALCHASCEPPAWLEDGAGFDALDIISCRNGLLDIPSRVLLDPTPTFFTLNALPFDYSEHAPEPTRWLQFLREVWRNDHQSRDTLQEWMGYLLTPRTHLQKMALLVGKPRSGKGTIGRVIGRLLGARNVCAPTLASMSKEFGRQSLIGKSAAIVSDARISGRVDTSVITESLLAISGEDTQSIPRKYLNDWTGKLTTRFTLISNELPHIEDNSNAFVSRFIVLVFDESFLGREDSTLFEAKLVPELPGILNWALEGYDRLQSRGHFVQPSSSAELIREFEDLGSPINAFLRDCCDIGRGHSANQPQLFERWRDWCRDVGRDYPGTAQAFAKQLRAAVPWLESARPRIEGSQVRQWQGVGLKWNWRDAVVRKQ